MEPSICQTERANKRGRRRRGGRVPTTHNALIYGEGEGVVHGRRPAGYRGGGRPICSALGRSGSARLTKPPTSQEGRCQAEAQSGNPQKITETTAHTATVGLLAGPVFTRSRRTGSPQTT